MDLCSKNNLTKLIKLLKKIYYNRSPFQLHHLQDVRVAHFQSYFFFRAQVFFYSRDGKLFWKTVDVSFCNSDFLWLNMVLGKQKVL